MFVSKCQLGVRPWETAEITKWVYTHMCTVFVVEAVALWFRACRLNQEVASCTMQRAFCLGRLTKKSRVSHFLLHTCHTLWQRSVWPRLTWRVFIYGCVIVFKFVLSHRVGFNEALLWGTDFIDIWSAQSRGWLAHWRRAVRWLDQTDDNRNEF